MKGIAPLIALRKAGKRPACVHVVGNEWPGISSWHQRTNDFDGQFYAEIHISASENLSKLDLRPLIGLCVMVDDFDSMARTREVFEACVKAGSKLCAGVFDDGYDCFFEVVNG